MRMKCASVGAICSMVTGVWIMAGFTECPMKISGEGIFAAVLVDDGPSGKDVDYEVARTFTVVAVAYFMNFRCP